jgi:putative sterol carrier protein
LNADDDWLVKGRGLTYSMVYGYQEPIDRQFLVRFEQGRITEVREARPGEEESCDAFVSAAPDVWRGIFEGRTSPTFALATGKVKLRGNKVQLMKNMNAFTHVITTMQNIAFH